MFRAVSLLIVLLAAARSTGFRMDGTGAATRNLELEADENLSNNEEVMFEEAYGPSNDKSTEERKSCTPTTSCSMLGGRCTKKQAKCKGTVDRYGCRGGKKCVCCIPDQTTVSPCSTTDISTTAIHTTVIPTTPGACPDGFFKSAGSSQCFKLLSDKRVSWVDAKDECRNHSLVLAKPTDAVATSLREDIINRFGSGTLTWLDARFDSNGKMIWQRAGTELNANNNLWYPNHPGSRNTTNHCLCLHTTSGSLSNYPTQPYYSCSGCTSYPAYPLCEME